MFSRTDMRGTKPNSLRSSVTMAIPQASASAGDPMRTGRPARRTCAPAVGLRPKIAAAASLRPAPSRPARPRISPARSENSDPRQADFENDLAGNPLLQLCQGFQRPPHHKSDQPLLVQFGGRPGGDVPAVAHHRDGIGQPEDFGHAVRNVDDGHAALLQVADDAEEPLRLTVGQRGGRLVHDEQVGLAAERLGDFDALALGEAPVAHPGQRVQAHSEPRQQARRFALHRRAIQPSPARRLAAHADVFGHGQIREREEFLVNHGKPPARETNGRRSRESTCPRRPSSGSICRRRSRR